MKTVTLEIPEGLESEVLSFGAEDWKEATRERTRQELLDYLRTLPDVSEYGMTEDEFMEMVAEEVRDYRREKQEVTRLAALAEPTQ